MTAIKVLPSGGASGYAHDSGGGGGDLLATADSRGVVTLRLAHEYVQFYSVRCVICVFCINVSS